MVGATDNLALKVFAAPEHLSVQVNSIQFNTIYLVVSLIKNANNNTFPLPKTSEKNCKFLFHYLGQYAIISKISNFGHFQWKSETACLFSIGRPLNMSC